MRAINGNIDPEKGRFSRTYLRYDHGKPLSIRRIAIFAVDIETRGRRMLGSPGTSKRTSLIGMTEMLEGLPDFCEMLDTEYGKLVVNKFDTTQTPSYRHTRRAMNHDELVKIRELMHDVCGNTTYSIVDVGAHIGTWGVFFGVEPQVKRIYSFEALPVYYDMLCATQRFNPKMRVFKCAVSDTLGTMKTPEFDWCKPTNFGGIELGDQQHEWIGQDRLTEQGSVPMVTLDHMLDQFQDARLLKIDVEGMEIRVLRGATKLIERYRPVLFVEYIKSDQAELMEFFRQYDYQVDTWHTDFLCVPR